MDIYTPEKNHFNALLDQFNNINFPLNRSFIEPKLTHISDQKHFQKKYNITLDQIKTNHHGECYGYRLKNKSIDVTYIPDNQLHYTSEQKTSSSQFIEFCKNTDILIHDSQFTQNDLPDKLNWGHSLFTDTVNLAEKANTKQLYLFHHDPCRTTDDIESMIEYCKQSSIMVKAAKEGQSI